MLNVKDDVKYKIIVIELPNTICFACEGKNIKCFTLFVPVFPVGAKVPRLVKAHTCFYNVCCLRKH
jgi:hypothetical protein